MAQCYRWYCMFCLGQTGFFPSSRLQDLTPLMRLSGAPVKETNHHPACSAFHWFPLVTASATRSRWYRYILCPLISLRQNSHLRLRKQRKFSEKVNRSITKDIAKFCYNNLTFLELVWMWHGGFFLTHLLYIGYLCKNTSPCTAWS